jgi:hypothetical protein
MQVLLLKRDGVVEEELWSAFERAWDSVLGEVPREGSLDIGEHKSNVVNQRFWEDGAQSGECVVCANSDTWDCAICEDENSSNGVEVLLNLSSNALLVVFILLNTASVGQPRRVEDSNLGKRLSIFNTFKNVGAY